MWNRGALKTKAKAALRETYWKAFLVSLVVAFIGGNGLPNFNIPFGNNLRNRSLNNPTPEMMKTMVFFVALAIMGIIVILIFRILVGYALEIGGRRYFIGLAAGTSDMNELSYSFTKTRYSSVLKTMLWRAFLNFLWYLLLFFPGIVKAYAYSMVPYILAENPTIGRKRAIQLSVAMTRGEKFKMFVLDLSFIGWCLLGLLAFIVGMFFVLPYINATKAELYLTLRSKALETLLCTREELCDEEAYPDGVIDAEPEGV